MVRFGDLLQIVGYRLSVKETRGDTLSAEQRLAICLIWQAKRDFFNISVRFFDLHFLNMFFFCTLFIDVFHSYENDISQKIIIESMLKKMCLL